MFSSVAHGSSVHECDPYDVESIHAEAREVFHVQLDRATTPEQALRGHGRTLLVLGDAGCGKTHLPRALRSQAHGRRLGYVGYLQMSSEVGDYARYVLRNLIDSLERPYDAPVFAESGLLYLSDGLAEERRAAIPTADLARLRDAELAPDDLDRLVGGIVDRIVRTEGLGGLEVDVVQALLLLQRRDPAIQRRVIKYLRCEALTQHDRDLLGGLASRDQPDDPLRTIRQLATVMHELQLAALVLVVDQLEDAFDAQSAGRMQHAFDALRAIADAVPSTVVVIACLDNVYEAVRPKLTKSLVDRLERDPAPIRLSTQREVIEIEHMLARRLEHLYGAFDVAWRDDDPLYPFTREQIDAVAKKSAREVLAKLRDFHASCIAARTLVGAEVEPLASAPAAAQAPGELDRLWNDAAHATALPDGDDELIALIDEALRGAAVEIGAPVSTRRDREMLWIEGNGKRRLAAICNKSTQGGHFGKQLEKLRAYAPAGTVPVVLRSSDFEFKPKSKPSLQVAELQAAGGIPVALEEAELRAALAFGKLTASKPAGFAAWRSATRPLANLDFVRKILELERVAITDTAPWPVVPPPPAPPRAQRPTAPMPASDPARVRLGTTTNIRSEVVSLDLEDIKRHVALLGGPGSGKTTAALSIVEQLLERDVSVLLVDRKGDLASYARPGWWSEEPRRVALRDRIDVAMYTPGNAQGRPLRLPLLPRLANATAQDIDEATRTAAAGLGAMMGLSAGSTKDRAKESVLLAALKLHAGEREVTLDVLRDTIDRPDPELLRNVNSLQRHFAGLAENLDTLRLQRGALLAGEGEPLDIAELLPQGKTRLSIINTQGLGDLAVQQFWVSRLLIEIGRLGRRRPSTTLQAVAVFDEADAYIPASSKPATKEPMFDLLKRARSAGIGVVLATQSPGDFDYKARDNIATFLVGRVQDPRAIEKMRNLLASYPNVGPRLASQTMGHFFVLQSGEPREIKCDPAMMHTEQLSEAEVTELARRST